MSYACVIVARRKEDVKFKIPNSIVICGPLPLNECRNLGASGLKSDLIAFIDDDNRLDESALAEMAKAFDSDKNIGVVSPLIFDGQGKIWFAGGRFNFFGMFRINKSMPKDYLPTDGFHDVFMVRRSAFEKAGGFDSKHFPFYLGEADLGERMKEQGYRFVVAPRAKVWHEIDGGLARRSHIRSEKRAYLVGRNRLLFLWMHKSKLTYVIHATLILPFLAAYHIVGMANQRRSDFILAYIRGILDGLFNKP